MTQKLIGRVEDGRLSVTMLIKTDQKRSLQDTRRLFFGMQEGELAAIYLDDSELMNALGDFENAMASMK